MEKNALKNWTKEKVEKRIKRDDYIMLVAEEDGELVAYLAALVKGDFSFVRWMGVKKDHQGKSCHQDD